MASGSAPPFMAPKEVMKELTVELAGTPSSLTAAEPKVPSEKEPVGTEFLSMVTKSMPPGAIEWLRPSVTTRDGYHMGLTENYSATYLSSGNACLDFFFQVVPSTEEALLELLLERAWREDALTALKLVFHLRGVRGTGKADKERFYYAVPWLHLHHPATLRENMAVVVEFGYFKDALEILLRLVEGPEEQKLNVEAKERHKDVRKKGMVSAKRWKEKQERIAAKKKRVDEGIHGLSSTDDDRDEFVVRRIRRSPVVKRIRREPVNSDHVKGYYARKGASARAAKEAGTLKPREERIAASVEADKAAKQKAALTRKEKRLVLARTVTKIFTQDQKFQALYVDIAKLFAGRLKEDLKALEDDRLQDISLAAKWAPSLDSSYDLRTLLCYAIAAQIYPNEVHLEYKDMDVHEYSFKVRERLRKEVLTPLRKVLDLPEVYTSSNKWGEVNYRRVASVAMTRYKNHFLKHDEERFTQYLTDVKSGKEKLAAGALLPHMILKGALEDVGQAAEVAELQWKRLVEDLKQKGSLSNCIAVCDVSGSMIGEPMEVCIALGMLLSELSEEPWKGNVITFSQNPQIHRIGGESLKDKHDFTMHMQWGMNTNFQRVFDTILTMAQLNKLAPEKMIKRLFVFSDMEFDQASSHWETDYKAISRKFKRAGYGTPPDIVFWNLRSSQSVPVVESQTGVALVSGFSKNILKIFLEQDGAIDPLKIMNMAIAGKEYSKLKVVD